MTKKLLFSVLTLTILSSCFKTAEEIHREKLIDQQLSQSSKIIADLTGQVSDLKSRQAQTSGQIEEYDHQIKTTSEQQSTSFTKSMIQLQEQMKLLAQENLEIKEELKRQKSYLEKVNQALSQIGGTSKKSSKSLLQQAHKAFEKNKQKEAARLYNLVLKKQKINNSKKNHVFYNLGLLKYWNKKYDDALVYFSKIYTKYPKSSFAPNALLHIARSFNKKKMNDEAVATYQELIDNYPKSSQAVKAKKEIK